MTFILLADAENALCGLLIRRRGPKEVDETHVMCAGQSEPLGACDLDRHAFERPRLEKVLYLGGVRGAAHDRAPTWPSADYFQWRTVAAEDHQGLFLLLKFRDDIEDGGDLRGGHEAAELGDFLEMFPHVLRLGEDRRQVDTICLQRSAHLSRQVHGLTVDRDVDIIPGHRWEIGEDITL